VPALAERAVRFDVGNQSAGMINNVGRDQHLSYVQYIQQQRASFARDIAATKTKARWFIWLRSMRRWRPRRPDRSG
jgi:hypothetical protein